MKRKEMVLRAAMIISLLIAISFNVFIWAASWPTSDSATIWLPEKYSIEDLESDNNKPIESFKNESGMLYVSFEAYQELFSDKESNIIVVKDGIIYYITDYNGKTFWANDYLHSSGLHSLKVASINADGFVDIHQEIDSFAWIFGSLLAIMTLIIAGILVYEFRNPIYKS